jgi:hypothetical protein
MADDIRGFIRTNESSLKTKSLTVTSRRCLVVKSSAMIRLLALPK